MDCPPVSPHALLRAPRPLVFVSASHYLSLPRDPHPWVVQNLITAGGLTNLYGKPKAGKSFVALALAQSIAAGHTEWQGFAIQQSGPVMYVQMDTPRGEWANRMLTFEEAGLGEVPSEQLYLIDAGLTPHYPFDVLDPKVNEFLKKEVERIKPVVVFFDTLREVHGSDENDSTAMRNVVTAIVAACKPSAVVLLSHARKDSLLSATTGDDLMNDVRGSSYISGRMDVMVRMSTNGKRASRMTYQSRSAAQDSVAVTQDEHTGFVYLDGDSKAHWTALKPIVERFWREHGQDVTVAHIVAAVKEAGGKKGDRQTRTDVETHLSSLGWKRPARQKRKKAA